MQKGRSNPAGINIAQALIYPFYQWNYEKTLGFPSFAAFLVSVLGSFAFFLFIILVQFVARKVFGLDVDFLYGIMRPLLLTLFCGFYFPCLLGYGWKLLDVLRRKGLDAQAPDATLEEILLTICHSDNDRRYDSDADTFCWKGIGMLWWDGCKLLSCICIFILSATVIFSFLAPAVVKYINKGALDSPLIAVSIASIASWLCIPFFVAALVQSAETRRVRDLLNIQRTAKATLKCYGKCLIATLLLVIVFALYEGVFVIIQKQFYPELLKVICSIPFIILPAYVAGTFTACHLIAQAFNNYQDGDLPSEQDSVQTAMSQSQMSMGAHNLLMTVWVVTALLALSGGVAEEESGHVSSPWALLLLGISAIMAYIQYIWRQRQKEIYDCNQVISHDPEKVENYIKRAEVYCEQGQLHKSIDDYTHVLCLDAENVDAYIKRGNIYRWLKKIDKAIADYQQAAYLITKCSDTYPKHEYQKAIDIYDTVISLNSNTAWAFTGRGLGL